MDWKLILQLTGILLGLLYLWLEYRADIRLWIVGLIMPLVHGTLYLRSGLYADASMQLYYILAGLYGWAVWHRSRTTERRSPAAKAAGPEGRQAARIRRTPLGAVPRLVAVYAALHALLYFILVRFTDSSVPFWDSLTTALCIVAYWMLSRKYVEQWLIWCAVDAITVGLYLYKEIPFTAGLYALYTILAVAGYRRWLREMRSYSGSPSAAMRA